MFTSCSEASATGQLEGSTDFRALLEEAHAAAFGASLGDVLSREEKLIFTALQSPGGYNLLPPVSAFEALRPLLARSAAALAEAEEPAELILFDEFIEKAVQLHRSLSLVEESVLLIGEQGSGRRSLVRLCAHICSQSLVELNGTDQLLSALTHAFASPNSTLLLIDATTASVDLLAEVSALSPRGRIPHVSAARLTRRSWRQCAKLCMQRTQKRRRRCF